MENKRWERGKRKSLSEREELTKSWNRSESESEVSEVSLSDSEREVRVKTRGKWEWKRARWEWNWGNKGLKSVKKKGENWGKKIGGE